MYVNRVTVSMEIKLNAGERVKLRPVKMILNWVQKNN